MNIMKSIFASPKTKVENQKQKVDIEAREEDINKANETVNRFEASLAELDQILRKKKTAEGTQ